MDKEINNQNVNNEDISFPFFRILYINLVWIILFTILGCAFGIFYAERKDKPIYTAQKNVMLVVSYATETKFSTELRISEIYVPQVAHIVTSGKVRSKANALYNEKYNVTTGLGSGSIGERHGGSGLIFSVSYSDYSEESAEQKLDVVIEAFKKDLTENVKLYINADAIDLVETQRPNDYIVSSSSSYVRYVLIWTFVGLGLAIIVAMLRFLLDNKLKDVKELERITGVNLLAYIDKQ